MKDLRGSHVAAVRSAINRELGIQLFIGRRRRNSRDIMAWKGSEDVKNSYNQLFTDGTAIEKIVNSVFPSATTLDDKEFTDLYIYTAAVCDIILNPDNPNLDVTQE